MLIGGGSMALIFDINYLSGTAIACSALGAAIAIYAGSKRPVAATAAG